MSTGAFFLTVFLVSLSGVMAPGPVTATSIGMGAKSKWAGVGISIGHGIVEFPLMILLMFGAGEVLKGPKTQVGIAAIGGLFLILMGAMMLRDLRSNDEPRMFAKNAGPITAGVLLTAGNPYFLVWWATAGLALVVQAQNFGIWAFAIFAILHWTCDFLWLSALGWASYNGSRIMGPMSRKVILAVCGSALLAFGIYFIYNAAHMLGASKQA